MWGTTIALLFGDNPTQPVLLPKVLHPKKLSTHPEVLQPGDPGVKVSKCQASMTPREPPRHSLKPVY